VLMSEHVLVQNLEITAHGIESFVWHVSTTVLMSPFVYRPMAFQAIAIHHHERHLLILHTTFQLNGCKLLQPNQEVVSQHKIALLIWYVISKFLLILKFQALLILSWMKVLLKTPIGVLLHLVFFCSMQFLEKVLILSIQLQLPLTLMLLQRKLTGVKLILKIQESSITIQPHLVSQIHHGWIPNQDEIVMISKPKCKEHGRLHPILTS